MKTTLLLVVVVVILVGYQQIKAEEISSENVEMMKRMVAMEKSLLVKIAALEEERKAQKGVRAFLAAGSQRDIHPNSIIKFGNVKMNIGGCYNPASSIFTCPDNRLYLFYVTISSYNGKGYGAVWYLIVQDGKARVYGFTGSANTAVGTHFAMIRCHPGSHVWVKQGGTYQPQLKQGMWEGHSQFGGYQIA